MVFSSLPPYLVDPPNWHQQQQSGVVYGGGGEVHEGSHLPPPPADAVAAGVGGGAAAVAVAAKPGSMSERARQLKIPLPEAALKCPRCESTNTKFCYFNNYSLSQPRHFCKTCRRYWTRGGALRSVPVGGGCRRNKKSSKGSKNRSKSPATTSSTSTTTASAAVLSPQPAQMQLPFLPTLHHLGEFGGWDTFGGGNEISSSSGKLLQQVQQFPFSNIGNGINNYHQLEGEDGLGNYVGVGTPIDQFASKSTLDCGVGGIMKIEELNLSRNFLGISGNDQFNNWGTSNVGTWSNGTSTDHNLSSFASSSTSHLF